MDTNKKGEILEKLRGKRQMALTCMADQQYGCCRPVPRLCLTLCDPMDCSTPEPSVLYHAPEFTQTHVHGVRGAI